MILYIIKKLNYNKEDRSSLRGGENMNQQDVEKLLYHILMFNTNAYKFETKNGWVNIDELVYNVNFQHGKELLDRILIYKITKDNPKFTVNMFRTKIRANPIKNEKQSVLKKAIPPDVLYYKTNRKLVTHGKYVIVPEGDERFLQLTTSPLANEHGLVFEIDSRQMFAAGYAFYISNTGMFMTEKITSKFVKNVRINNNGI